MPLSRMYYPAVLEYSGFCASSGSVVSASSPAASSPSSDHGYRTQQTSACVESKARLLPSSSTSIYSSCSLPESFYIVRIPENVYVNRPFALRSAIRATGRWQPISVRPRDRHESSSMGEREHERKSKMRAVILAIAIAAASWTSWAMVPSAKVEQGLLKGTIEDGLSIYWSARLELCQ